MSEQEHVVVSTSSGFVRGKKAESSRGGTYFSFQGIPYGKPPVGDLRFKAPVPCEPWKGIRDALVEGPVSPSVDFVTKKIAENSSEDCLYLNVYSPKIPANDLDDLRAVMFWIHGGGFNMGSGNTDTYGPDYLVAKDVVLVTCNYRLGALGFLSLQSEICPGNNGLRDMILALTWCQKNIAKFGGDPKNVTIFGESAGGAAVHYLTLMRQTEGLFHKAIVQSGVAINPWAFSRKPREAALKLAEVLGLKLTQGPDVDQQVLGFLRTVKPEDLVLKGRKILREVEPEEHFTENAFVPCIEPNIPEALISRHPEEIYRSGEMRKIPFFIGSNTLEGIIMIGLRSDPSSKELKGDEDLVKLVPVILSVKRGSKEEAEIVKKIRDFYFPKGYDEKAFINALSRIYFLNGINQIIEYHSKFSSSFHPTFVYRFSYDGDIITLKKILGYGHCKGTCHADELVYLFSTTLWDSKFEPGTKDYEVMERLTKMWTDFAKCGNPRPDDPWPHIAENEFPYIEIEDGLTLKKDLEKEDFVFWKGIAETARQAPGNCKF